MKHATFRNDTVEVENGHKTPRFCKFWRRRRDVYDVNELKSFKVSVLAKLCFSYIYCCTEVVFIKIILNLFDF